MVEVCHRYNPFRNADSKNVNLAGLISSRRADSILGRVHLGLGAFGDRLRYEVIVKYASPANAAIPSQMRRMVPWVFTVGVMPPIRNVDKKMRSSMMLSITFAVFMRSGTSGRSRDRVVVSIAYWMTEKKEEKLAMRTYVMEVLRTYG